MKIKPWLLSLIFFTLGVLYYLIHQNRLIILWNRLKESDRKLFQQIKDKKKKVKLYYWKDGRFFSEESVLVWFSDDVENIKYVVNYWLNLIYQEQIIDRKVFLVSVGLSQSCQDVYLSFDSSPLEKDWSIMKKWYLIEGLFKTLSDTFSNLNMIYFRVQHRLLEDDHLDFSQGWPISGFLEREESELV